MILWRPGINLSIGVNLELYKYRDVHYENTPMQYTATFHCCKNVHFQMKFFNVFLIFAQNIACEAVLTSTYNLCFGAKIKNYIYPCKPQFYHIKVVCNGGV